jgi:hypothetical protein
METDSFMKHFFGASKQFLFATLEAAQHRRFFQKIHPKFTFGATSWS